MKDGVEVSASKRSRAAGRDFVESPVSLQQVTIHGPATNCQFVQAGSHLDADNASEAAVHWLDERTHWRAMHAEIRKMFIGHRSVVLFLVTGLIYLGLLLWSWSSFELYPHGVVVVSWGVLVIGTAAFMVMSRQALYDELKNARRRIRQAERKLIRATAEQRISEQEQ